jgi:hypothetical protein
MPMAKTLALIAPLSLPVMAADRVALDPLTTYFRSQPGNHLTHAVIASPTTKCDQ